MNSLHLHVSRSSNFPVVLLRLFVPLSIPFFPLWGGIASLIADSIDVILIDVFNLKKFKDYPTVDKILDMYYLLIEFLVTLTWKNPIAALIGAMLFILRGIGFFAFLATQNRLFLFLFPNIFEYYFLIYAFYLYLLGRDLSFQEQILIIIVLIPVKLVQEYILHVRKSKPWEWTKKLFLNYVSP